MTSVISTSAMVLLQSATGITKCDGYYKVLRDKRSDKSYKKTKNNLKNKQKRIKKHLRRKFLRAYLPACLHDEINVPFVQRG